MKKCKSCDAVLDFIVKPNGLKQYNHKYGYGIKCGCYSNWLMTSEKGKSILSKSILTGKQRVEKEKKAKDRKRLRKLKDEINSSDAMKLADTYFSRYIRLKYSTKIENKLYCTCFTSGELLPIKEVDNGHYQKREHKATRYHEDNCRPQSKTDNGDVKHNGKQALFGNNLRKEIGDERVNEVERLARTTIKADSYFYRAIATKYRLAVNKLQEEIGIKIW